MVRDAPAISMPVPTTPSADQATADETARNPVPAGEGQAGRYLVAIGRVVLENHAGDDFLSSPDIFVQVQRRDPEVLASLRLAEERLAVLGERRRAAEEERQPLQARQSDNEPGNEPVVLLEREGESEVVPGPELTTAERERLRELQEEIVQIITDQLEAQQEIERLRDAITGITHTVTTPGYILDFGGRAIQEVFPGDELWIAVYDRDTGEHDLYGSTALYIGGVMLRGEEVELTMPNVESLILRIVSP